MKKSEQVLFKLSVNLNITRFRIAFRCCSVTSTWSRVTSRFFSSTFRWFRVASKCSGITFRLFLVAFRCFRVSVKCYPVLLLICCFFSAGLKAQIKAKYHAQNYIGLLEGEYKGAFQLQTIHGAQYRSWYAGGGVGLDYYMYRSIPVFLSLNRDIAVNKRTFFISGDIGTNYPWVQDRTMSVWGGTTTQDFSPGLYWAAGLGYKAYLKNKSDAIIFNLGYSYKNLKEEWNRPEFCNDPPCSVNVEKFNYQLNRISLRLGWQF